MVSGKDWMQAFQAYYMMSKAGESGQDAYYKYLLNKHRREEAEEAKRKREAEQGARNRLGGPVPLSSTATPGINTSTGAIGSTPIPVGGFGGPINTWTHGAPGPDDYPMTPVYNQGGKVPAYANGGAFAGEEAPGYDWLDDVGGIGGSLIGSIWGPIGGMAGNAIGKDLGRAAGYAFSGDWGKAGESALGSILRSAVPAFDSGGKVPGGYYDEFDDELPFLGDLGIGKGGLLGSGLISNLVGGRMGGALGAIIPGFAGGGLYDDDDYDDDAADPGMQDEVLHTLTEMPSPGLDERRMPTAIRTQPASPSTTSLPPYERPGTPTSIMPFPRRDSASVKLRRDSADVRATPPELPAYRTPGAPDDLLPFPERASAATTTATVRATPPELPAYRPPPGAPDDLLPFPRRESVAVKTTPRAQRERQRREVTDITPDVEMRPPDLTLATEAPAPTSSRIGRAYQSLLPVNAEAIRALRDERAEITPTWFQQQTEAQRVATDQRIRQIDAEIARLEKGGAPSPGAPGSAAQAAPGGAPTQVGSNANPDLKTPRATLPASPGFPGTGDAVVTPAPRGFEKYLTPATPPTSIGPTETPLELYSSKDPRTPAGGSPGAAVAAGQSTPSGGYTAQPATPAPGAAGPAAGGPAAGGGAIATRPPAPPAGALTDQRRTAAFNPATEQGVGAVDASGRVVTPGVTQAGVTGAGDGTRQASGPPVELHARALTNAVQVAQASGLSPQQILNGAGAASGRAMNAIIDRYQGPNKELTEGAAALAGMMAVYTYALERGDVEKAGRMAFSLIQRANLEASTYGKAALAALNNRDVRSALKFLDRGVDWMPDGTNLTVAPDGQSVVVTNLQGQSQQLPIDGRWMLALATGLSNGTLLWQSLGQHATMFLQSQKGFDKDARGRALRDYKTEQQIKLNDIRLANQGRFPGGGRGGGGGGRPSGLTEYFARANPTGRGGGGVTNYVQREPDDHSYDTQ